MFEIVGLIPIARRRSMTNPTSPYSDKLGGAPHSKQALRLWLKLLSCSTVVEKRVRALLEERFGSTLPRFELLAALERNPGGLTMTELSSSMMVSNGNVTGVVSRLIRDGMVSRETRVGDRRVASVRLTPKGRRTFTRMARIHEGWIEEMFSSLTDRQIGSLMTLLGELRRSVESAAR
jgi:DNA-binding MarR family transcriptional regulator